MRRLIRGTLIVGIASMMLVGCGSTNATTQSESGTTAGSVAGGSGVSDTVGEELINDLPQVERTQVEFGEMIDDVEIDLTVLSGTMVYAEVYNMMMNPDEYIGKTIKMDGLYSSNYWEETQCYYHFIVIEDATACCQSGLEIIWDESMSTPGLYDENTTSLTVTGTFEQYEELGEIYYCVRLNNGNI